MYVNKTIGILGIAVLLMAVAAQGGLSSIDVRAHQPSSSPYLTINRAVIVQSGLDAIITTNDRIPTDGSGGAFGYGILTQQGVGAVIVSTTHQGVRDSVTQGR